MFDNLNEGDVYLVRIDSDIVKPITIEKLEESHSNWSNLLKDVNGEFIRFKTVSEAKRFLSSMILVVSHYGRELMLFK